MIEAEWWDYDDAGELADAVASDIEFILDSALDARGEALVALPGGDVAAPVYARLAKAKLNWKRVTILPTDDRLVAPTDPASVVGLLAKTFLPIGARVIPLVGDAKAGHKSRRPRRRRAAGGDEVAARSRVAGRRRRRRHRLARRQPRSRRGDHRAGQGDRRDAAGPAATAASR